MSKAQLDMFAQPEAELFPAEPVVYRGDPDRVRGRLERILAEARAADRMPWPRARERLYRTIVPQMTLWLPDEEAEQYRLAFATEMDRLG